MKTNRNPLKYRIIHTDEGYKVEGLFDYYGRHDWITRVLFSKKDYHIKGWYLLNLQGLRCWGSDFDEFGVYYDSEAIFKKRNKAELFIERVQGKSKILMQELANI